MGEAVAKPQAAAFLFCVEGRSVKKRTKVLPKPWPLDHALRKVEELCAIHNANGMIALLFQPDHANRIEKKKGPPFCMYAGGPWNSSAFLRGVRGVRRFIETNSGESN